MASACRSASPESHASPPRSVPNPRARPSQLCERRHSPMFRATGFVLSHKNVACDATNPRRGGSSVSQTPSQICHNGLIRTVEPQPHIRRPPLRTCNPPTMNRPRTTAYHSQPSWASPRSNPAADARAQPAIPSICDLLKTYEPDGELHHPSTEVGGFLWAQFSRRLLWIPSDSG